MLLMSERKLLLFDSLWTGEQQRPCPEGERAHLILKTSHGRPSQRGTGFDVGFTDGLVITFGAS